MTSPHVGACPLKNSSIGLTTWPFMLVGIKFPFNKEINSSLFFLEFMAPWSKETFSIYSKNSLVLAIIMLKPKDL